MLIFFVDFTFETFSLFEILHLKMTQLKDKNLLKIPPIKNSWNVLKKLSPFETGTKQCVIILRAIVRKKKQMLIFEIHTVLKITNK